MKAEAIAKGAIHSDSPEGCVVYLYAAIKSLEETWVLFVQNKPVVDRAFAALTLRALASRFRGQGCLRITRDSTIIDTGLDSLLSYA